MKKIYILIGPPGAGKGTQAEFLQKKLHLNIIQPGAILRNEIKKRTKLGRQAAGYVKKGELVPDDLVASLIFDKLHKSTKDVLLDGYPRNLNQLVEIDNYIKDNQLKALVIEIQVRDSVIRQRIEGRRSCSCGETYHIKFKPPKKPGVCDRCGKKLFVRQDSKPEVIKNRIANYKEQTKPILKFFKNNKNYQLIIIDGNKLLDQVKNELLKKIK